MSVKKSETHKGRPMSKLTQAILNLKAGQSMTVAGRSRSVVGSYVYNANIRVGGKNNQFSTAAEGKKVVITRRGRKAA